MINLTEDHAKLVMQALDVATKAGGLQTAATLLPVAVEIQKQLEPEEPNKETHG